MGSNRGARDALYRILRQQRPAQVVAIDNAGRPVSIALRDGKGRWDGVVDAAFAMLGNLDRLELRNEKGEVWRTWEPPASAGKDDDDESGASVAPQTPASVREDESFRMGLRLSEHVQRACDTAVERHLQATQTLVDSLIAIVKAQNERIVQQEKQASHWLKFAQESVTARAEAHAAVVQAQAQTESPADKLMTTLLLGAFAGDEEPAKDAAETPPASTEKH